MRNLSIIYLRTGNLFKLEIIQEKPLIGIIDYETHSSYLMTATEIFIWSKETSYKFISKQTSMPITLYDLPRLSAQLPTAFVQVGEDFELRIISGIERDENLCVSLDNEVWHVKAFPSLFRCYPFFLVKNDDKFVLCFDESSERINRQNDGERVFQQTGELSNIVKKLGKICK